MIAGHRLCMETAVAYSRVFPPAVGTHGKSGHRGLLPVVRQIADDGETRAALRTVDKRITQAMRLPQGTVKNRLARGRKKLAELLEKEETEWN